MQAVRDRAFALLIASLALAGCGVEPPRPAGGDGLPDTAVAADRARLVVLRATQLRLEPDSTSPGVVDVPGGTLLRVAPESAGAAEEGWVRVATWDDRRGWLPASLVVEARLWAHYGEALGGVSPGLLRPAYPVEGGRWGVEAPFHSPGFTQASSAWLLGDSARAARIVEIDSIENVCGEERHRFAVTDRIAAAEQWPLLDVGVIAAPSGRRPAARLLAIHQLVPHPALAELAGRVAAGLGPPGGGDPASIEWLAFGEDAAWATFSWPSEDAATRRWQFAAALVLRRSPDGWELAGTVPVTPSSAEIPTPAWRPVAAYSTGTGIASILLLESFEYEGAHLDVWIERGGEYLRLYQGYYWGC